MTNPLCRASYLGHKNICTILLKYGADINIKYDNSRILYCYFNRSSDGRTPLMWCAFRNNDDLAKYIMDNGA